MTVRELLAPLARPEVNLDAEVMIRAPLECDRGHPGLKGNLHIPTRGIEAGAFPKQSSPMSGKPWVMIIGCDGWEQSPPAVSTHEAYVSADPLVRAEQALRIYVERAIADDKRGHVAPLVMTTATVRAILRASKQKKP